MPQRIVILGGGTGGTLTANRLRARFPADELEIVVVDQDDQHVYQPGLLFVPFGYAHPEDIVRRRGRQLHARHPLHRVGDRPRRHRNRHRASRRRHATSVSRARRRDRRGVDARGNRRADRPGLDARRLHLLRPGGCGRARGPLGPFRGRAGCRQRRRHADQVSGRAAGVLLPRRLVLPRARRARRGRAHVRDAPRRSVHEAGRVTEADRSARREAGRAGHRVQHRRSRRGRPPDHRLRRARSPVRPRRRRAPARWRRVRRPLDGARRRAELRADRRTHVASRRRSRMCSPSAMQRTYRRRKPDR